MVDILKDFDKLIPDKRTAILAGKTFDVSLVSTRQALEYIKFRDVVLTMTGEASLRKMASIVAGICGKSAAKGFFKRLLNKPIDENWLLNNSNFEQLQAFMDFVIAPLMAQPEEVGKEKKK